jgi:ssDNA-binding Zn-finger/Zn-ribbon topoisomerase 1
MGTYQGTATTWQQYIIYLRKSRQDDQRETVEEVLAKHETQLQEYAEREFGGRIPEENIYREVVSAEDIAGREEVQKVLARIEDPAVKGVLVVDPQRLSRGDLEDCGRLISDFRYTHTKVVTPYMTYDLENKMERRFFQDELLRGRDYLEYVKDVLRRGRENAAKRGCYISPTPPYGFNRIKKGKDWTLEANDDADAVRLMFEWYVKDDLSLGVIARRLDDLGYKSPQGGPWSRRSIREMLLNVHYIGKVKYNDKQSVTVVEDGARVQKVRKRPTEEVIITEGIHDGFIDPELFAAAQVRLKNTPRNSSEENLVNVLAGVLVCSECGRVMIIRSSRTARPRYMCPSRPQCRKSAVAEEVVEAVIVALEQAELPNLRTKLANGDGDAAAIQKRRIAKLVKQLEEYRDQEDEQYDLLEQKKYTQALFDRRHAALRQKMEACEKELRQARAAMPKNVDYAERIVSLEAAIAALRDPAMPNRDANRLLRAIIDRIEYSSPPVGSKETDIRLRVFLRL